MFSSEFHKKSPDLYLYIYISLSVCVSFPGLFHQSFFWYASILFHIYIYLCHPHLSSVMISPVFLAGKTFNQPQVDPQKHHPVPAGDVTVPHGAPVPGRAPDSTSPPPLGSRCTRPLWGGTGKVHIRCSEP